MADIRMSFIDHLDELRKRIVYVIFALVIGAGISYYFWKPILDLLLEPLGNRQLYFTTPIEPFIGRFRVAIFSGLFIIFPIIIYQIMIYIAPALRTKEKKIAIPIIILLVILFYSGIVFGYQYILPVGVNWLIGQGQGYIEQILTIDKYVSFVFLFLLAFGGGFQTPVAILVLVKLGAVTPKGLRKNWRVAYIVILTIAAIITPDWSPITMAVMALPMLVRYELSILLAKAV